VATQRGSPPQTSDHSPPLGLEVSETTTVLYTSIAPTEARQP
jgi:hypothetical protein